MTRLVVIVPTLGRGGLVTRLVQHLARQKRLPDEVVLSAPDATHIDGLGETPFPVRLIFGKTGLAAQRNAALQYALDKFDVVTFFDDDFIPADDYLFNLANAFETNRDWVVVMGNVIEDGACGAGLSWEQGVEALLRSRQTHKDGALVVDHVGAYGCNMSMRTAAIRELRFDERLPLYGWQEDIDFTSQLRRRGRVVCQTSIEGVHLGIKAGKVSGKRFGYSQVINPLYLIRKGSVPADFALKLMFRNLVANLVRSFWPESYIDRRGRLRGNLLAIFHALTGRIDPEFILRIKT